MTKPYLQGWRRGIIRESCRVPVEVLSKEVKSPRCHVVGSFFDDLVLLTHIEPEALQYILEELSSKVLPEGVAVVRTAKGYVVYEFQPVRHWKVIE